MNRIHRIVLTGGPCAGKTTAMAHISDRLQSLGLNVFIVPESATMMILGGIRLVDSNPEKTMQLQTLLMKNQLHLEQTFLKAAQLNSNSSVILYDRGFMDSSAFVPPDMWQAILDEQGWSNTGLRDKHYDAVIHLVTAALGAPEAYTLENNAARSETPEQAAQIDRKIQEAWVGHPHLRVIDNSTGFEEKIRRTTQAICNVVGVPEPLEMERKFLVNKLGNIQDTHIEKVEIEQVYLVSSDGIERVRKRGQHGTYTYTHTVKYHLATGKNIERERMISSREYLTLLDRADPTRKKIEKQRWCFLFNNQYFELDFFKNQDLIILEVEVDEENMKIDLPPFIEINREVTGESRYSNANLALLVKD